MWAASVAKLASKKSFFVFFVLNKLEVRPSLVQDSVMSGHVEDHSFVMKFQRNGTRRSQHFQRNISKKAIPLCCSGGMIVLHRDLSFVFHLFRLRIQVILSQTIFSPQANRSCGLLLFRISLFRKSVCRRLTKQEFHSECFRNKEKSINELCNPSLTHSTISMGKPDLN